MNQNKGIGMVNRDMVVVEQLPVTRDCCCTHGQLEMTRFSRQSHQAGHSMGELGEAKVMAKQPIDPDYRDEQRYYCCR